MAAGGGVWLGGGALSTVLLGERGVNAREPVLRAAHVTDIHLTDTSQAPRGVSEMFRHMFSQDWRPDVVLNTGDSVMAVDGNTTGARAKQQIDLWRKAVADCPVPIRSCLGNHDVWNGAAPDADVPLEKAGFALMTEVLEMPAPYYSFDQAGWHFVVLNSVCEWPKYGRLTDEHLAWLVEDLKATSPQTPICVLSHLPILSVTSSVYGDACRKERDVVVPGTWQHFDCWTITEVFRHHPNVKLCLSGHMHTCDRCEYRGVWYICGGAVSGSWWGGAEYGFPPCYGQIDFYADGAFTYRFTDYGWQKNEWKGKALSF